MSVNQNLNKGPLTHKTFRNQTSDNEKLGLLGNQMGQMKSDFDELKKARELAKKQLEQQFQDIYDKINRVKDFVRDEGIKINNTMVAFQNKFENELKNIRDNFQKINDEQVQYNQEQFDHLNKQCENLDKKIEQEKEERIAQHQADLSGINNQIDQLFKFYETEKQDRIESNAHLLKVLEVEAIRLKELLEKEIEQRKQRNQELIDHTNHEINEQKNFDEDFNKKALEEFHFIVRNVQEEMDNRFDHQDQIVKNLTNIVTTIQQTLKVIGKDV